VSNQTTDQPLFLVFSQVFVPDPAAVGQHFADVVVNMARRGHRVRVYCANRGFEDPSVKFPTRENLHGADVRRLPLSSFGKKSLVTRGLGTLSLLVQFVLIGLTVRNVAGIFFSTSPPFIGLACAIVSKLRGVPIAYWAMDLNPDQVFAMGKVKPASLAGRTLERTNRVILGTSKLIVPLDRFMADRIRTRGVPESKLMVLPPWPHEDHIEPVDPAANPFRLKHGLAGKFVVMYSGNHSPANPLRTLLDAAVRFKGDPELRFLFVGGGGGKKEVDAAIRDHGLTNAISLPYQPLADTKYSLPAADVHVVSLGNDMVGIIHPCKIYGAMAVGRPILFLGPRPSHVSDLLEEHRIGWHVSHGDVDACARAIELARSTPRDELDRMGDLARQVLHQDLGQDILCNRLCDRLEDVMRLPSTAGKPAAVA
jgi:glycosyltransferase involved in cell wall biosynthesis